MSRLGSSNPELQLLRRLSRRRSTRSEHGVYLVDGPVLLDEVLAAGRSVRSVYVAEEDVVLAELVARAERAGASVRRVQPGALAKVLDLGTPNAVVAVVDQHPHRPDEVVAGAARAGRPLLVAVELADPGNLGTLVRAGEAAGCAGVLLVGPGVDPFNPKVVRAAAGSLFRLPVAQLDTADDLLAALGSHDVPLASMVVAGGLAPEDAPLAGAVALAVGSEAHGLPGELVDRSDLRLSVPMAGATESLNAAVAAAVVAFEAARQRRGAAGPHPTQDRSGGGTAAVGHNGDPVEPGGARSSPPGPEHGSTLR